MGYTYSSFKSITMIHTIKCAPKYFQQIKLNAKTFECRKNDRDYKEGDKIILKEYDKGYTAEEPILILITSVLHDFEFRGVSEGYIILSISIL